MTAKTTAFLTLLSYQLVTAVVPYWAVPMGAVTVSSLISLFGPSLQFVGESSPVSLLSAIVVSSQATFILGSFFQKLRFKGPLRVMGFAGMIVGYVILAGVTVMGDYGDRSAQVLSYLTGVPFIVLGILSFRKMAKEEITLAKRLGKDTRNPDAHLLDEILAVGMTSKEAVAVVSDKYSVARLPRFYSESQRRERIEVDTEKATFVINTKDGKVTTWNAK